MRYELDRSRIVRDGGGLKASVDDVRVTADVGNDMAAVPDPASDEEEELPYDWRKQLRTGYRLL